MTDDVRKDGSWGWLVILIMFTGIIGFDHWNGGKVFPSQAYCIAGAGLSIQQPGSSRYIGTHDLGSPNPTKIYGWDSTRYYCLHGSMFEGWKTNLTNWWNYQWRD